MAITTAPADLSAQEAGASPSTSSCLWDSSKVKAAQAETAKLRPPILVHPTLHEAEARLFEVAQQITRDPQLFSLEVQFEEGFLKDASGNTGFNITANYATPCDQTQFLSISLEHLALRHLYATAVGGVGPFVPPFSGCGGGTERAPDIIPPRAMPLDAEPRAPDLIPPPSKPLDAEPPSKHLPLQGWSVDLPQLRMIAEKHHALFANGVRGCAITTITRLREDDSKAEPKCGGGTVFNWNGVVGTEPKKRLLDEQGQRSVIELLEHGRDVPRPHGPDMPPQPMGCELGHYLIVDASSGNDVESGTYLDCPAQPPA